MPPPRGLLWNVGRLQGTAAARSEGGLGGGGSSSPGRMHRGGWLASARQMGVWLAGMASKRAAREGQRKPGQLGRCSGADATPNGELGRVRRAVIISAWWWARVGKITRRRNGELGRVRRADISAWWWARVGKITRKRIEQGCVAWRV